MFIKGGLVIIAILRWYIIFEEMKIIFAHWILIGYFYYGNNPVYDYFIIQTIIYVDNYK